MNLWNIKNLEAPPTNTYKTNSNKHFIELSETFKNAIEYFQNHNLLNAEAALLSRCIYRMKMKFRSDKGFKSMEKLNRSLLQYLRLDFCGIITNFYELLPTDSTKNTYVPTRNMLDFILVRLQGLTMLMSRIVETTLITASSMENKVLIGQFWQLAFIVFSLVSRIYLICKHVTRFCCKFYSEILPFRNMIKNIGTQWLPDEYIFPTDLKIWLNKDWLDEDDPVIEVKEKIMLANLLKDDSDDEICDDSIEDDDLEIVDDYEQIKSNNYNSHGVLTKKCKELDMKNDNLLSILQEVDIGQVIKRECTTNDETIENYKSNTNKIKIKKKFEANKYKQSSHTEPANIETTLKKNKRKLVVDDSNQLTKKKRKIDKFVSEDSEQISDAEKFETNDSSVKTKKHSIKDINSVQSLKDFIKCEEMQRNENKEICKSKNLDKLQWNMLQNLLKSYIKKANKVHKSKSSAYILKAKDILRISFP